MTASVDVVLQDEVIGFKSVAFIMVAIDIEQVTTFEVRIKDEATIVVFECVLCSFGFDLWEIAFGFGLQVDACDVYEVVSKVVLFGVGFKAMVVYIPLVVDIPESTSEFLFAL